MAAETNSSLAVEPHFVSKNDKEDTRYFNNQDPTQLAWPNLQQHESLVNKLAAEVRVFAKRGEKFRINHGSSNSTRPTSTGNLLDISALNKVLLISKGDPNLGLESWCLVEPNVPMDKLVEATLLHGLVPPVVMEFPGITVGGGFSGTSAESSSFRHGFFSDNVLEAEMILGDGQVIKASHTDHQDLFVAAAGALGTLSIVTSLKLRLIPAKKFVHVRYTRLSSFPDALTELHQMQSDPSLSYLDGILYSKHHAVAITGTPIDDPHEALLPANANANTNTPLKIQTFSHPADDWFYLHVRDQTAHLSSSETVEEYVPLAEFLFRYDRGGFWVGEAGYDYFRRVIPFTRAMRWLLDDFSHTRTLYHALHATGVTRELVVQDVTVPWGRAAELVEHIDHEMGIWPLWLCPLRGAGMPSFHPVTSSSSGLTGQGSGTAMSDEMLSIGIWGWGPREREKFLVKNRGLEAKLEELGGRKWLYAHMFYTEEEFWRLYDREWYEGLREKYHAASLTNIFDKVKRKTDERRGWMQSVAEMWPIGGLCGMWRAVRSGDISLHRNARWKWAGGR